METTLSFSIEELKLLSIERLRARYRQLFGEEHTTKDRNVLVRRMAWRLQSLAEGGLSERARQRARELVCDADIRVLIPRRIQNDTLRRSNRSARDRRLPPSGTVLSRQHQNKRIEVLVLDEGFEYGGVHYDSLSSIATAVTGTRWNGYLFFGLSVRGRKRGRR
jgi:hypothetical protein